jgi:hypothetical protein
VASPDGLSRFYASGALFVTSNVLATLTPVAVTTGGLTCGVRMFTNTTAPTTAISSLPNVTSVFMNGSSLYLTVPATPALLNGFGRFGNPGALPTTALPAVTWYSLLNQISPPAYQRSYCQALFQNATTVWLAGCGQVSSGTFIFGKLLKYVRRRSTRICLHSGGSQVRWIGSS